MMAATEKIIVAVLACWTSCPLTRVERQRLGIRNGKGRHHSWPHGREGIQCFAGDPLAGLPLQVPRAHIVHEGIAGHISERLLLRHLLAACTHDDREFPFIVDLAAHLG